VKNVGNNRKEEIAQRFEDGVIQQREKRIKVGDFNDRYH